MVFAAALVSYGFRALVTRGSVVAGPLSVLNVEKLSLPANTAVGTQVQVTDGLYISGAGTSNGLYIENGSVASRPQYTLSGGILAAVSWSGAQWVILSEDELNQYVSDDDVAFPWLVTTWATDEGSLPLPTLTHPAVQQLASPSTAQGGVFVSGGTQDGVYSLVAGALDHSGVFNLFGSSDFDIRWVSIGETEGWAVRNLAGDGNVYYSLSDVATPDLASNWKNASDDSPASITVTSVTEGEIDAGLFITNDGITNGSSYVLQPFQGRQYYMGLGGGGSNNMHWDTDFDVWTDDVGAWTTSNVAFPWQGADNGGGHTGATFARNDVANEANWDVAP